MHAALNAGHAQTGRRCKVDLVDGDIRAELQPAAENVFCVLFAEIADAGGARRAVRRIAIGDDRGEGKPAQRLGGVDRDARGAHAAAAAALVGKLRLVITEGGADAGAESVDDFVDPGQKPARVGVVGGRAA